LGALKKDFVLVHGDGLMGRLACLVQRALTLALAQAVKLIF
jgi:hypothetical protein